MRGKNSVWINSSSYCGTEHLIWKDFVGYRGVKPNLENNDDGVCSKDLKIFDLLFFSSKGKWEYPLPPENK